MNIKLFKTVKNAVITVLKKNILFTWILSYLVITLLSVISNGIIYFRAKKAIKNELTINSVQAMDEFKTSIDNIFINASKAVNTIQDDESVSRLCNTSEGVPYSQYAGEALSATNKLKDIINTNSYLSEIYIYYKNIDLITSSRYMYTKELFFERTYSDSDLTYEDWSAEFEKNSYAAWSIISHSNTNKQTMEVYYQIPEFFDKFDAVAVLSIDTDQFFENAKMAMDIYSDIGLFIVSKDNEVIMSNGVIDSIPEKQKDSIVISAVSDTIGWRYVSVIPSNVFDQKLAYFKLANILNVIICLVLSGVLSFFFAKMNVRPFSKLKLIYNSEDDNDMTLINDVLNDYRSAKQTQAEMERSNLMGELISTGRSEILSELEKNGVDFSDQYFCVILFKLVNVSKLFEDENDVSSVKKYDALKLIVKNVLEEIINEKYRAYVCKFNGQIVAVVNINHDYILDFNSDIEKMLKRGKEFISSNFAFSFTPFVGGIHDVKTLHKSYLEARNALQYRTFIPTSDIVFCEDINADNKTSEESAVIPAEKKKQLISILQLGDEETSLSMVNSLMRSVPDKSPIKYRVFLFDLISTLIHAFESVGNDELETTLSDEVCKLAVADDVSAISEKINEVISKFCLMRNREQIENETKEIKANLSKKDIIAEIKVFIRENYANQTLNIAMIGEYFNITPYYVSNLFKKSENMSMLDYINITRINKAKELLRTTDMSLESIALQCGYSNIRTFMRVFQRIEGITPGKYKEINKNDHFFSE